MMPPESHTTTVSTKGQVILPKALRQRRRWSAGTRLVVEETNDGLLLKQQQLFPPKTVEEVAGSLRYEGPAKTIEEMDEGVMAEARRRARD